MKGRGNGVVAREASTRGIQVAEHQRAPQTWAPSVELFVKEVGLYPSPDHYCGKGASSADLNGQILERIRQKIESHVGESAAENYVRMIEDIPYLSAEVFLTMLYSLEACSWRWERSLLSSRSEFAPINVSVANGASATHTRDETHYIKTQFAECFKGGLERGVTWEKYGW